MDKKTTKKALKANQRKEKIVNLLQKAQEIHQQTRTVSNLNEFTEAMQEEIDLISEATSETDKAIESVKEVVSEIEDK